MRLPLPRGEFELSGHWLHAAGPTLRLKVPAAHAIQDASSSVFPGIQRQLLASLLPEGDVAVRGQPVHSVVPIVGLNVPAAHAANGAVS